MQRFLRPSVLRGIARTASRYPETTSVQVQRVKVARPRWKLYFWSAVAAYVSLSMYDAVVLEPFFDLADKQLEDLPQDAKKELEEAEYFYALPFTMHTSAPERYDGRDPDVAKAVQALIEERKTGTVRTQLAETVRHNVGKTPALKQALGGGKLRLGSWWLEAHLPPNPPPEVHQLGVLFDNEGVSIVEEVMDPELAQRKLQIFRPLAVTLSLWDFTKVFTTKATTQISEFLSTGTWPSAKSTPEPPNKILSREFPLLQVTKEWTREAMIAFKARLSREWKRPVNISKGSIVIMGSVQILGDKATAVIIEVLAFYDPKTGKIAHTSMRLKSLSNKYIGRPF